MPISDTSENPDSDPEMASSSARNAGLVAIGIIFSRLSGIVREIVLAAAFGASSLAADAFASALAIPKILQNLLGEGALSASFIPEYSKLVDDRPEDARRLAGAVFGLLVGLVSLLVAVVMIFAKPIAAVVVFGADEQRLELITRLLQIMTPGIGFIVFAAWCLGILNAHRDFFLSYVAPVVWNVAIIAALLGGGLFHISDSGLAKAAAFGVLVGGLGQFVIQLPRVFSIAGPIRPNFDRHFPPVQRVLERFVPGVAGRGVLTLSSFTDLFLASFLVTGAFSILAKAQVIYMLPVSVFAVSIAAADLPELSRNETGAAGAAADGSDPAGTDPAGADPAGAADRLRVAVERVTFFLTFCALAFVISAEPIVATLFERGNFSIADTEAVSLTLSFFSLGLVASGLSRVLQTASFAKGDASGPAKIAFIRLLVAAAIGSVLMFSADRFLVGSDRSLLVWTQDLPAFGPVGIHERSTYDLVHLGAVGLAIGGAVAAWVEFVLLSKRIRRLGVTDIGFKTSVLRLIPAAIIAAVLLPAGRFFTEQPSLLRSLVSYIPAGVAYVGVAAACKSSSATQMIRLGRRILVRNRT